MILCEISETTIVLLIGIALYLGLGLWYSVMERISRWRKRRKRNE